MSPAHSKEKDGKWVNVSKSQDGSGHYLGVTRSGKVFSWGSSNSMGQLGRRESSKKKTPLQVEGFTGQARKTFAGGSKESGHSAILDAEGKLWLAGCDRWQQLGLGSSHGGSAGYTWEDGRIWRPFFTINTSLLSLMKEREGSNGSIRDMALGGDHTVVLSSNSEDVYTFGKGGEGQLGVVGKPFVSAPVRSSVLSDKEARIAAVCAIQHCSLTLDGSGNILKKAGRCRKSDSFQNALNACINIADTDGLLRNTSTVS
mmetsp:Transcript_238/g.356  ORF Transcript_238/g.356 Transcript_238/m.356 type:complete len:258 (+) Transcript_238:72-845(+)